MPSWTLRSQRRLFTKAIRTCLCSSTGPEMSPITSFWKSNTRIALPHTVTITFHPRTCPREHGSIFQMGEPSKVILSTPSPDVPIEPDKCAYFTIGVPSPGPELVIAVKAVTHHTGYLAVSLGRYRDIQPDGRRRWCCRASDCRQVRRRERVRRRASRWPGRLPRRGLHLRALLPSLRTGRAIEDDQLHLAH